MQQRPYSPEILPISPRFANRYSVWAGRGGAGREGGEPHFITPGEITMGRLPRPYCSLFAGPGLTSPFPVEPEPARRHRGAAAPSPRRPLREVALPSIRAAVAFPRASQGAGSSAPRATGTQSGKGGRWRRGGRSGRWEAARVRRSLGERGVPRGSKGGALLPRLNDNDHP